MSQPNEVATTKPRRARRRLTDAKVEKALRIIADGGSLRAASAAVNEDRGDLVQRFSETPELQRAYELATIHRATLLVEEILDISEEDCTIPIYDVRGKELGRQVDRGRVAQNGQRIAVRQWAARHLLPKYSGNEEKRELADALATLITSLSNGGRRQSALPVVEVVEDDDDD